MCDPAGRSIEEPKPSHIEKLVQLAGEEKAALNGKMDKNMEPLFSWWNIPAACWCGLPEW